ncbi:hypothetical protein RF11_01512 [Thelohanellus kitauei]|uniref:Uncharacterized protein n=1 Tax=Thelohanellus kitauei TaxID=669202 RepID=A0A0C2MNY2_THEKT|nr:hypothetical protein RF11_01512 [Thelohanellus kitauei]
MYRLGNITLAHAFSVRKVKSPDGQNQKQFLSQAQSIFLYNRDSIPNQPLTQGNLDGAESTEGLVNSAESTEKQKLDAWRKRKPLLTDLVLRDDKVIIIFHLHLYNFHPFNAFLSFSYKVDA